MDSSSNHSGAVRALLIQRADELAEFEMLLDELAVPVEIHRGALPESDALDGFALAIVSGKRLVEGPAPSLGRWPRTIAVVDGASKTLVAHLNRLGVGLVVRRPIHPRTLRLLLLHELYRGPERRVRRRVSIGHPIRARVGVLPQRATLLELSSTGARIELPSAPKVGSRLRLVIGRDLTDARPLRLHARVVRCLRPGHAGVKAVVGVKLCDAHRHADAIRRILDRFSRGPAPWKGRNPQGPSSAEVGAARADPIARASGAETAAPEPAAESRPALPPSHVPRPAGNVVSAELGTTPAGHSTADEAVAASAPDPQAEHDTTTDSSDRRSDPRIAYERRVVALGEEAARVLVGRDLSHGGMRIMPTESVSLGHTMRVALHCGTLTEPLIVTATALRDDGDEGIVLSFPSLSAGQRDHLEKIIAGSGPIPDLESHSTGEDEETAGVVLGEMLERVGSGEGDEAEPRSAVDADEAVEDAR